jgi:transposase
VGIIGELNRQIAGLEASLAEHFETHPDADIYLSQPRLGIVLGARVLGEFGDDPIDTPAPSLAKIRPNLTTNSGAGKKRAVLARHVCNRRLYDSIDRLAFSALSSSPGARAFYDHIAPPAPPTTKPWAP